MITFFSAILVILTSKLLNKLRTIAYNFSAAFISKVMDKGAKFITRISLKFKKEITKSDKSDEYNIPGHTSPGLKA